LAVGSDKVLKMKKVKKVKQVSLSRIAPNVEVFAMWQ
jgi:hypothetical protein